MEIEGLRPPAQTADTPAPADNKPRKPTIDYDAFLQLLVAQMANQDPLSPMQSSEYVAQLASFSNVEQSIQMNAKLDQLITATSLARASDVVGRTVQSADGAVSGLAKAARISQAGVVAVLEDGREIPIQQGVVIR